MKQTQIKSFIENNDYEPRNIPGTLEATEAIKDIYQVQQYEFLQKKKAYK